MESEIILCWLKINWDWKSIVTESKACDWKTMEIEIKQVIEKQLRCFIILIEFNADNKQCWVKNCWDEKKMRLKNTWFCWLKLMLSENNRDAKECWLILMLMLDFVDGVHTVLWNVVLSILRSQMDFCTMKIHLGSQNWQDYISNGRVIYCNILHSSEFHVAALW